MGSRAEKITPDSVIYKDKNGSSVSVKADTVVLAIGDKPDASLYEELKDTQRAIRYKIIPQKNTLTSFSLQR